MPKPKTGAYVECTNCGDSIYREKNRLDRVAQHFCDKQCHDQWQARNKVKQTCQTCGLVYELSASQKFYRSVYCSKACEARGRIKRPLDREHNGKPAVLDHQGYVRIYQPDHPKATKGGWIFEHRWVVEQALGRILDRDENVHHLNHVRSDNRPENLQLLSHSEHSLTTGRENGEALRAALEARQKLAEYERRFGPLTQEVTMPTRENKDGSVTTWAEGDEEPTGAESKTVEAPKKSVAKTQSAAESK